jgi:general nucleoside transport system permease protein
MTHVVYIQFSAGGRTVEDNSIVQSTPLVEEEQAGQSRGLSPGVDEQLAPSSGMTPPGQPARDWLVSALHSLLIPFLAVFTALLIGGVVIFISNLISPPAPTSPLYGKSALQLTLLAYQGLWDGAFGSFNNLSDTIVVSTPYIFGGLAVALGFRTGLFNIGVEGQIALGSLAAAAVGFSPAFADLSPWLLVPMCLVAGCVAGAIWGGIPGILKAQTGAHEVITTIMLNYIAIQIVSVVVNAVKPGGGTVRTPYIADNAHLPVLLAAGAGHHSLHIGTPLALLVAFAVYWLLWRTTIGFELRTVGTNASAARYAGISVKRNIMLAMALSGLLGGLAGAVEVTGVNFYHSQGFSHGYGFDAITVALLGRSNPFGVVAAAFLFGALKSSAPSMQFYAGTPQDVVSIIQALILLFIAADEIVRYIYRVKSRGEEKVVLTRGWGG